MKIQKHIPNTITCCNLLCGSASIILSARHLFVYAVLCIILGAVFDLFDGMVARLLKVSSPLGLQLDSLADDITFGLAPALMLYFFLQPVLGLWSLIALLMAAFSALRLAKFNIDERQRTGFIGLATPGNAIFWGSVCCLPQLLELAQPIVVAVVLLLLSLFSCYLLLAEIPFFSFKFHSLSWNDNSRAYIFLIVAAVLLLCAVILAALCHNPRLVFAGSAGAILWYVLFNIIIHLSRKR